MITVVLTKYKRPELFEEQLNSIINQSTPVNEILICDNSQENKGVWERFKVAKRAKNEFVCIFDDDTIPGPLFIESCFTEFWKKEGLYGTRGLVFSSSDKYEDNFKEYGWCKPNSKTMQVDYVTHSWFFKKSWLDYFWEVDNVPLNYGEDMNFSYQLQKHGIPTLVPHHRLDDKSCWGSLKGKQYGDDEVSLWIENPNNFRNNMYNYFDELVKRGWKLLYKEKLL